MKVELLQTMGDDLTIVNAARVSYAKESTWACGAPRDHQLCALCGELNKADAGLIGYLMKNHHGTPFEMVQFQFRITCPIGVAREWQRHRIGSFNEVSTRYVEMAPDFYLPADHAVRRQVGKPGHYIFETVDAVDASMCRVNMQEAYNAAYAMYKNLLAEGIAKELARNVLPIGLMTQFYWSVNLRSLFNFLMLRNAPTALLEIRELAEEVERLATAIVPEAFGAFAAHGRMAP